MTDGPLTLEQATQIADTIAYRQTHFDGESLETSIMVVLLNTGSKWVSVRCINEEWSGTKGDLVPDPHGGVPKCPNGHVLVETGPGKKLAYVDDIDYARLFSAMERTSENPDD